MSSRRIRLFFQLAQIAVDELGAQLQRGAGLAIVHAVDPAADAVPRLEHQDLPVRLAQPQRQRAGRLLPLRSDRLGHPVSRRCATRSSSKMCSASCTERSARPHAGVTSPASADPPRGAR